jgi:hypothetical protein
VALSCAVESAVPYVMLAGFAQVITGADCVMVRGTVFVTVE